MFFVIFVVCVVHGYPASWVQKIGQTASFNEDVNDVFSDLDNYFKSNSTEDDTTFADSKLQNLTEDDTTFADSKLQNYTKMIIPFTTDFSDKNDTIAVKFNETRNPRQEDFDEEKASQEADSSEEEDEGGNMLTGLLGAFLGGLSKPDGSIDLEAILGLLGSLSTQNPDGTYDFSGLSDLLRSFFGGDAGGGGSDIGAFVGGLLGAVIKGVANPPGAKGAGILAGKVVTGILPALSGPPPSMEEKGNVTTKAPPLDSGAFLTGFLKTALGSGGNGMGQGGKNSKYTLFKLIFSAITGVFSAASSLSSGKSDWN